jgi:hypothetical protein
MADAMCMPSAPDPPPLPAQRQEARQPAGDIRARLSDRDRRRRGYAATMFAPSAMGAPGTTNVLGV